MPQPRGAMAQALREAVASAPSTQQAIAERQEAAQNANDDEANTEITAESIPETEEKAVDEAESADREIEYLNDLPDVLGWDAEQFYALPIRLADDQEPIPLGEVKDKLQSVSATQQELAQQRAALEEEKRKIQRQAMQFGQANQVMTERMAKAGQTIAAIHAQYNQLSEDWNRRRDIEPGKVALEQQELAQARAAAENEYRAAATEASQQQTAAFRQWIYDQHLALTTPTSRYYVPDLADPNKAAAKQEDLKRFAMERYGAVAEDLSRLDAKTVLLLNDAMEGVRLKAQATDAVKTLRKHPKVVPKGVRLKRSAENSARVAEKVTKARQTKTRRDITNAVRSVLGEALSRQ